MTFCNHCGEEILPGDNVYGAGYCSRTCESWASKVAAGMMPCGGCGEPMHGDGPDGDGYCERCSERWADWQRRRGMNEAYGPE